MSTVTLSAESLRALLNVYKASLEIQSKRYFSIVDATIDVSD